MSKRIVAQDAKIQVGVDVHTVSHVVAAKVNGVMIKPRAIPADPKAWVSYLKRFPGCELDVIYESGPHGYNLYDWLTEMRCSEGQRIKVHVVPAANVPQQPGKKRVKTDRRDSRRLIQALEDDCVEDIVVPDKQLRIEREIVRTRDQLKKD